MRTCWPISGRYGRFLDYFPKWQAMGPQWNISGWWFGTCFIFPYIRNNNPNWLKFFRGVETTNQIWEFPKTWGYPIMIIHVFKRAESEDQGKSYEALALWFPHCFHFFGRVRYVFPYFPWVNPAINGKPIWLVQQNMGTDSTKSWPGWLRHEAKQTKAQPISQKKAIQWWRSSPVPPPST